MNILLFLLKYGGSIFIRMALGFLLIFVFNLLIGQANSIPNNLVTNAIIAGLGIPGVLLILAMKYFLQIL